MIYADYNGSTKLCYEVKDFLVDRIQNGSFTNPNATHKVGKQVMYQLEKSRRTLAKYLGCKSTQILFNSGSTEGISHIFYSICDDGVKENKNIIITSSIEHSAILNCCKHYEEKGFTTEYVKAKEDGTIDLDHFKTLLNEYKGRIAFVTIMAANNETGVIQPYQAIGKLCQDNEILFFSDTTQYIGKTEFSFEESFMDFAVLSSHKIGSLIGSGLIIAKDPSLLKTHIIGGGQERGMRGGTQNYIGIEAMAVAIESFAKRLPYMEEIRAIKNKFESNMKQKFPGVVIIGGNADRLATTTLIAHKGLSGQQIQADLEAQDVLVTTSSACSDSNVGSSKVLKAMGIPDEIGSSVVRISFCLNANQEVYDEIELALTNTYNKLINL